MINQSDIIESLEWAIGMAEEAIMLRENDDDPEDTEEVLQMHRDALEKAKSDLAILTTAPASMTPANPLRIIVSGNPLDGLEFNGPFITPDAATRWAERGVDGDWWLGQLHAPTAEGE